MLKQRILTAVVLAPLALFGVFGLPLNEFVYLLDFVVLVAAWEWANLAGLEKTYQRIAYVAMMAVCVFLMHAFQTLLPVELILSLSAACWFVALFWVVKYPEGSGWQKSWQRLLIGLIVLLPSWLALVQLKGADQGELQILLLLLVVWGADVGAYFAGKTFGSQKLAPNVSPGKTREGLYGGLLTCLLVAVGFSFFASLSLPQSFLLIVVALVTGLVSVLGDLFESMLKRYRGIKDSSQLLPGHGGILDRVDSLTAASPVFVLGLQCIVLG
ncbi:MAG: phosphatidate cytidylyltransferase [Neptuniibacter sp.]